MRPWAAPLPKQEQMKEEALVVSQHSLESYEVMCYLAARTVRGKAACTQPDRLNFSGQPALMWGSQRL